MQELSLCHLFGPFAHITSILMLNSRKDVNTCGKDGRLYRWKRAEYQQVQRYPPEAVGRLQGNQPRLDPQDRAGGGHPSFL